MSQPPPETGDSRHRPVRTRIGICLILLSGGLWFSLFGIPFLDLTTANKAILAGVVFAGVQLAWWTGAALAGPEFVRKLTKWFRRNRDA